MIAETNTDFHALLTDEYVAVANRGRVFTREGLRAVCQAHISSKGENGGTPIMGEADGVSFLQGIQEQRLAAYESCPSDFLEHAHVEDALRREYAGRILSELLQNAHDAIATEPIGSKGVGFKAVLNVCEGPRIHSGPLHCGFDRLRSREEFQDAGLIHDDESVPLMRLPFSVSTTDEPQPVRNLIAKYDTVVLLPFIGLSARERFLKEWAEYAGDPTLLLFLPSLSHIVWERHDGTNTSSREWVCERGPDVIEIRDSDNLDDVDRWRLSSSNRASVALRLDNDGTPVQEQNHPRIRVFFETDEMSPIPILIHAEFPLKEGRTNVLTEDEASGADVRDVSQEVAQLVRAALAEVHDSGLLLDLIRPRLKSEDMGKMEGELWKAIRNANASLVIPEAGGLKLDRVRLRPKGESQQTSWWWFDCDLWNAFKLVLSGVRAGQLSGLSFLPPGIDTEEREATVLCFNPGARLSVEELRALTILPVGGSERPVALNKANVFFPPKETPSSPPEGIDVRFLDQRFVEAAENHKKGGKLRRLLVDLLGVSEFEPLAIIEKAVLPILRTARQPEHLLDFLCHVVTPALGKDDLIFDWRNGIRRELAERLLVPLENGAHLPATQVYAGTEWTGDDFLERAFGGRSDRGFLHPPPDKASERERWEKIYRWVGVGWCPKVLPIVCHQDKEGVFEGPQWDDGTFPIECAPERWSDYCRVFDHFENRSRKARLRQNWTLDGGEYVLAQDGAFSSVNDNWSYYQKYLHASFYLSSNQKEDYDNQRRTWPSYLIWLFRTSFWAPVKDIASKQEPPDVFSRADLADELGGWGYELDGKAEGAFLEAIGVRSGWRQLDDKDWRRWLERATKLSEIDVNATRHVYALYEAALKHWSGKDEHPKKSPGTWYGPVWCVERRPDNTEAWRLAEGREDVFFVDRPDLAELRLSGLWVFPVLLNRLERASQERFGLNLLSEHISGKPESAAAAQHLSEQLHQRIEARLPALNAYPEVVFRENLCRLDSQSIPALSVVDNLKIQFFLKDLALGGLAKRDAYFSRNDVRWTLWLDNGLFDENGKATTSVWEYIASALVYANDLTLDIQPSLKDLLLYEEADLERKLLGFGVTTETVASIISRAIVTLPVEEEVETPSETESEEVKEEAIENFQVEDDEDEIETTTVVKKKAKRDKPRTGGYEAQEWMRDELRERLGSEGWRVSGSPTHDEEFRETDIELHHDQFGTFHLEVKHCESDRIYWSENEVEKAKRNPDRYFLVILTRDRTKQFEEYWIDDPLKVMKYVPRTGVWEWRGRLDGVELSGATATWSVPSPKPERPAAGFSFKLEIKSAWLKTHHIEFEAVKARMISQDFAPS